MRKARTNLLYLLISVVVLGHAAMALAVPASPDMSRVVQPDGSVIEVFLKGDEWNHTVETKHGYSIAKGADEFWYYVSRYVGKAPVLESVRAHEAAPAGVERHVRPVDDLSRTAPQRVRRVESLAAAPSGAFKGKVLFILVEYDDTPHSYPAKSFAPFISNSIKNYYSEASHGNVELTPAGETGGADNDGVVGWLNLGRKHPYPRNPDGTSTVDSRNEEITKSAILAADPFVNFASFDTNPTDGFVDAHELAVVVIVAGYEASYGMKGPNVWGHQGSIPDPPLVDEVTVGADHGGAGGYAQFGEVHQSKPSDRHQATMGIMVHELGHLIFGLPDLYDTTPSASPSSSGVGGFCVMSHGCWGKTASDVYSGQTPVLPCAWVRYNRGWATGAPVSKTGITLRSITAAGATTATSENTVFRRSTDLRDQYFLVENREPQGYDKGLERWLGTRFGGIAIWHVDDSMKSNGNDTHRRVDLEEADGTRMGTGRGEKSDLWYKGNNIIFDDASVPNSRLYDGTSSGAMVTTISGPSTTMNVEFSKSSGGTATGFNEQFKGSTAPKWIGKMGKWSIEENSSGFNDYYYSTGGVPETLSTAIYNQMFSDFDYRAALKRETGGIVGGDVPASGLLFRASGGVGTDGSFANGYIFNYLEDGYFGVFKSVNGITTALADLTRKKVGWTYSGAIKPGDAWNVLRVVVVGSSIKCYINGAKVWEGTDKSHATGFAGVSFFSFEGATHNGFLVDWATLKEVTAASPLP